MFQKGLTAPRPQYLQDLKCPSTGQPWPSVCTLSIVTDAVNPLLLVRFSNDGGPVKIQKGSWFRLLTFCSLLTLAASLGLAALFAGGAAALASSDNEQVQKSDAAQGQTFSGMITDSQCGARHNRYSGKRPADCARMCVQNGSKYLLINGDQKNILEGNEPALNHMAGQRATVTGTLTGDTIKVSAVDPVKE